MMLRSLFLAAAAAASVTTSCNGFVPSLGMSRLIAIDHCFFLDATILNIFGNLSRWLVMRTLVVSSISLFE